MRPTAPMVDDQRLARQCSPPEAPSGNLQIRLPLLRIRTYLEAPSSRRFAALNAVLRWPEAERGSRSKRSLAADRPAPARAQPPLARWHGALVRHLPSLPCKT
jgi:hypothetical protein